MAKEKIYKQENLNYEEDKMEKEDFLVSLNELSLLEYSQVFSCCSVFLEKGMDKTKGTFDLLVRGLPKNRNFLVAAGLKDIITYIKNLRFSKEQIEYLKKIKVITTKFAKYLKNFKFSGDVWAMPEGTIFFSNEPVIRITAPTIEGNLITTVMSNIFNVNTILASKIARVVMAAKGKRVGIGFIRTHGLDTALTVQRVSVLVGCRMISSPLAGIKFNLPAGTGNLYHAYVQNFPTEYEAFEAFSDIFPLRFYVEGEPVQKGFGYMVDTYSTIEGVKNAIKLAKKLKKEGKPYMAGISLDSGDQIQLSIESREMLDEAGFKDIEIYSSGNLDEFKISEMLEKGAQVDRFIAVTEVVTSADDPKLEVVYKLAEREVGRIKIPTMKWSTGKVSLPGKKQVFRVGDFEKDIIGEETENLGKPLLIPIMKRGKLAYTFPSLSESREYFLQQLQKLPSQYKDIKNQAHYNVETSNKLKKTIEKLKPEHLKNKESKLFFKNSRGDKLCGILSDPINKNEKIVVFCPGLSSNKNSEIYLLLTQILNEKGISTFRFDFYGHGESEGKFEEVTISEEIDDIIKAVEFVKSLDYKDICISGSSLSGIPILLANLKLKVKILALKSPVLNREHLINGIAKRCGKTIDDWKKEGSVLYPNKDGVKRNLDYSFVLDAKKIDIYKKIEKINIPTLFIYGTKDEVVTDEEIKKAENLIDKGKLEIVEGANHFYSEPEHFKKSVQLLSKFIIENI